MYKRVLCWYILDLVYCAALEKSKISVFIKFNKTYIWWNTCSEDASFLVVMKGTQIIDVSLTPGDRTSGYISPIVGVENGIQVEFDRKTETLFWVEGKEDDRDNVSRYVIWILLILYEELEPFTHGKGKLWNIKE